MATRRSSSTLSSGERSSTAIRSASTSMPTRCSSFETVIMLICQISDLHIKTPGALSYRVVDTAASLRRCVAQVLALPQRPDIVVATGDLTDFGRPEEYA